MQAELNRRPSTVYFSDIVGYTRLMGKDENAAFALMKENLRLHQEILALYKGKLIKELGDGILAVFQSSIDAVNASLEIQKRCKEAAHYQLRIGLQSGEVIFDHGDVFGDAVNVASRIQSVCIPGSVVFSERVCGEISKERGFQTVKLGGFDLKNVDHSLELYALANAPLEIPKRSDILGNIRYQKRNPWKYRIGIAAIVLLFGALMFSVFSGEGTWEKDKSVAVLPFRNLGGEDFGYFPNALTENLIDQIAKVSSIKTISYATMKSFSDPDIPLDSVAGVTKVSTILRGSVEKLATGVRINLQLVDVENNKNIWTETYIREGEGIPQFQNDIAREIARVLDARLTAEEATQIGKGETANPEAYDLLLKAKELYRHYDDSSLLATEALLKEAIRLDQNYALAYTWLAKTYYQMGFNHPDSSWYDRSLAMSEKALQLEPKLAEGFSARGAAYYDLGEISRAANAFDIATSYNPNFSEAIGNLASIHFAQGRLLDAIELQKKSIQLGPKSYLPYQNLGWIYKILGDFEQAHFWFEKSLEQNRNPTTYELSAIAYLEEGNREKALQRAKKISGLDYGDKELGYIYFYLDQKDSALHYFRRVLAEYDGHHYPKYTSVPIAYSYLLEQAGNHKLADSILNEITQVKTEAISLGYEDYYLALDLATIYAVRARPSESMKYLEIAFERGWRDHFFTEHNPIFQELRDDERYKKILGKIRAELDETRSALQPSSLEREK
ncbi:tetratricopeptide repeat protein [Algoriphagus sp. H41]|uniref:Tetratricopeptide repeat protein n=1 Tax=Algoriphagus oliviformis TaxID=2811231 RepID=A0ABS3C021_9BACT|nr:adenylate/guanylate cyclase domain-containing protein [Algoriphagus oliviformis]MBN7810455.1 tetratricopeptide repeat protein [Algoriphagus oliviformis]